MTKEFIKKAAVVLLFAAVLIGCTIWRSDFGFLAAPDIIKAEAAVSKSAKKEVRGVWISFHDYPNAGLYNKSEKQFSANADTYFKKLKKDGINTVYFHVVPCNDAVYPSRYLSWSSYMFESEPDYDPLEILVDAAHKYKMSFHAWINPYRKTLETIYNPAKKSSLNRILRIIKEIIKNYDVDGIHFDDYFYPSPKKGAQFYKVSTAERKAVINKMVKEVYRTIKNYDEDLLFGISPAGIVEYADSIGCDLQAWFQEEGYIDYIVPQIYWSDQYLLNGKVTKLFSNRLGQWTELNKNNKPMYIGLGLYRGGSQNASDLGWSRRSNNIVTQIKQLKREGCEGFVLFSSSYLYSSATQKEVKNYRDYINSKMKN